MFVQVAKRDGFVLTISSYASSDKDEISLTDCEKKAEEFAQKLGLDLKAVWSTKTRPARAPSFARATCKS